MAITKKAEFRFNGNLLSETGNGSIVYDSYPDITDNCLNLTGEIQKNIRTQFTYSGTGDEYIRTMTFWFKKNGNYNSDNQTIFYWNEGFNYLQFKRTGENTFSYKDYRGTEFSTGELSDGWHNIVFSRENNLTPVYLDGYVLDTLYGFFFNGNPCEMKFGYTGSETTNVNVDIDDFIVASGSLSAQEALDFYNEGRILKTPESLNYSGGLYVLNELIDYNTGAAITNYDLINNNSEGDIYYNLFEESPTILDNKYGAELILVFPSIITSKVISENGKSENYITQFNLYLPDPIIDKDSQNFKDSITINISKPRNMWGRWIYTIDGTDPTPTNGTVLYGPSADLTFNQTTTLKIYLYDNISGYQSEWSSNDFVPSNIVERVYTKTNELLNPYAVPAGCNFRNDIEVELINADIVGEIYYTLDNTEPTISSFKYSEKLKFRNGTLLKFKTISEDNESETIEEIYIKTGGNVKMEQAAGLKILKWIETGETDEVILGEGTVDGAALLSIVETPVFFNSNYAGASPIEARINTGANTFTADIHISDDVKQYISSTYEKSGTKFIFGMNTGAEAKTGQLTIHSMYDGEDTTDDIVLYKVVAQITDETECKIEGKKLTKLIFTVLADKKEISALSAPTPALGTEGTLAEAKYTYMLVASNDFGRVVSSATAEQTVTAPNDMITLTIPTTRPIGANKTNGYRMYRKKEVAGPTITYGYVEINTHMITAGAVVDNGTLTWTTATAFPTATATVPWYYAQGEC